LGAYRIPVKNKEIAVLTIRDHGVDDYAVLPDMDATDVGVLRDDDRYCLDELGRYLARSDAWRRFGAWLLHKHFEPAPGEVFVERTIPVSRETETAPVGRSAFPALNTTAIRFDDAVTDGVGVISMEFAQVAEFGDTSPLRDDDEAVLAGIAERLAALGKTHRFGVRLIRNPLGLSQHELLHETCDSARRALHCTVGERDVLLTDRATVQTAWRWRVVGGKPQPAVMGECTATCSGGLVGGHDIAHSHSETDSFGND
jgi:hypothetical protein